MVADDNRIVEDRQLRLRNQRTTLLSTRTSGLTATIAIRGHLDESAAGDLRDEILRAVDRGVVAIIVDLTDSLWLSFEGVKMLMLAAEMMKNRGAALLAVARDADGQCLVATGATGGARLTALLPPQQNTDTRDRRDASTPQ